jgi:DNA ligase-1
MTFADLVATSQRVAATRSRREKAEHLAALLRALAPGEIGIAVAFLSGELGQGRIGVGFATVRSVMAAPPIEGPAATLAEVDATLSAVAATAGTGSAGERGRLLSSLMARLGRDERAFLAGILTGELRQGAEDGVMADALARAASIPLADLRRALMIAPRAEVARAVLEGGAAGLGRFRLVPLRPVQPMLAETARDIDDAIDRLGEAALEFKLDGARIQVHRAGREVRVFTRALNDVTAAVPEVVAAALALPGGDLILDGEAIAIAPSGRPHPFQTTMRRFGRKLDVETLRAELALTPFLFDVLHADGESLIDRGAAERAAILARLVPEPLRVPRLVTADVAAARDFLARALAAGHEGVMAKSLAAPYEAGGRGAAWLKVKPAHTLDLVVLAVEWGSGRRKGLLSNLHLGARDEAAGGWVMLGKTFKGLTDEMLAWQTRRLLELETRREGQVVHVRPELVVEIAFDGVQTSSQYPGGLALRFARVKRHRPDKSAADADTIATVAAIHRGQRGGFGGDGEA